MLLGAVEVVGVCPGLGAEVLRSPIWSSVLPILITSPLASRPLGVWLPLTMIGGALCMHSKLVPAPV